MIRMTRICTFFLLVLFNFAFSDPVTIGNFTPPDNPTQSQYPPFYDDTHLPIVFVNDSGLSDNEVFILILGTNTGGSQVFIDFDNSGVGTLHVVSEGENGSTYSKSIQEFPAANPDEGVVAYVPYITGAVIYISFGSKLNIPVNSGGIAEPAFTNPADPNYTTVFDTFEFAYLSTPTQISANATAVSFFGIPLYGFISTPDPGTLFNTGLFQPRNFVQTQVELCFQNEPSFPSGIVGANDWPNLVLKNSGDFLRTISTQNGMAASPPLMSVNYLDNATQYGYSYLSDIWYGGGAHFKSATLLLTTPSVVIGGMNVNYTYTGSVNVSDEFEFTNVDAGKVVLKPPTPSGGTGQTTSLSIFQGNFTAMIDYGKTTATGDQPTQVTKLFQEAVIAGLIPTPPPTPPDSITDNNFVDVKLSDLKSSFYTDNGNLNAGGSTPWYDLYSRAFHAFGNIYTYAFDEPLWPEVQISSQLFTPNQTFLQIWIGPEEGGVATNTVLTIDPDTVLSGDMSLFTATVTAEGTTDIPQGGVQFKVNGTDEGAPQALNVSGVATYNYDTTGDPAPSTLSIQAVYDPSVTYEGTFSPSVSNLDDLEITTASEKIQTMTTITSTPKDTAKAGQSVTFSTNVISIPSGSGTPTGSVQFSFQNIQTGDTTFSLDINLDGSGNASVNKTFAESGQFNVLAVYTPSSGSDFDTSTSDAYPFTVTSLLNKHLSTTVLVSSSSQSQPGEDVTFGVTVTPRFPNSTDPLRGKVSLVSVGETATLIDTKQLDENGQAIFTTSFEEGGYTVYVIYHGSDFYYPSFSSVEEHISGNILPPTSAKGVQKKNKFASQKEFVNKITWKGPVTGDIPTSYRIYRDIGLADLVATAGGSSSRNTTFKYLDHRRRKGEVYTYYIVSVFSGGETSVATEVTVYPLNYTQ